MPKFCLTVTLGYGCEQHTQDELDKLSTTAHHQDAKESSFVTSITGFFNNTFQSTATADNNKIFVASASNVELSILKEHTINHSDNHGITMAAIFVPPSMMEGRLEQITTAMNNNIGKKERAAVGSCFWIPETSLQKRVVQDLLSNIHSSLAFTRLRGIIRTTIMIPQEDNAPADILIISASNLGEIIAMANGNAMIEYTSAVLKLLPLSTIQFLSNATTQQNSFKKLPISTCPVCLHRIDPIRLGLPSPTNDQLCSKFCPHPDFFSSTLKCQNQKLLEKWPPPSRCRACQVIQNYWNHGATSNFKSRNTATHELQRMMTNGSGSDTANCNNNNQDEHQNNEDDEDLILFYCGECAMHKTLWVCLTCGFVGCGRYSNKHSVEHFQRTNHPFALELATFRIWDYVHGEFGGYAHRVDLLECPSSLGNILCTLVPPSAASVSSPPTITNSDNDAIMATASRLNNSHTRDDETLTTMASSLSFYPATTTATSTSSRTANALTSNLGLSNTNGTEDDAKSPKKANMIGQEYEALLQSALEDQAQHYEGEITRLRAELTCSTIDKDSLSVAEKQEILELENEIESLKKDIDESTRELLTAQAQESHLRAASQLLLKECQSLKEEMKEIEKQTEQENEWGKMQVEDLEQQVSDLTANLRMRREFSQNQELNRAQIFGTSSSSNDNNSNKKRGKKKGRFFRR